MTEDDFNVKQREMLLQAQKVIDAAGVDYINVLKQHIQELKKSLKSDNLTDAIQTCHLIQSQAGTFDWHLATEISGWFKRLLKKQLEKGLNTTVNTLFQDSLDMIVNEELKAKSDAAIKLLLHIESELKKENIR